MRKSQFTLSQTFDKSILISIEGIFLVFIKCNPSWAMPIASRICLFFKFPNCSKEITLESTALSLLGLTLDKVELHKEIGL